MITPYDLYIRFLVTQGVSDLEEVNAKLGELNLSDTDQDTLDRHASLIEATLPLGVQAQIDSKLYSADFLKWMKVLEVEELWRKERWCLDRDQASVIRLVMDIHQDLQLRLCINSLIIKGVSHLDISQTMSVKFSTMLKDVHIALYERFFFNPRRMTRRDWRSWISNLEDNRESSVYFIALTENVEVLKTELDLPAKTSSSETLQYLLSKSYQKARQFLNINTPAANKEAREWIEQITVLIDKYEKYRSGDKDDFAKTLQLEFDYVDNEFPVPDPNILKELNDRVKRSQDGDVDKNETSKVVESK